MALTQHEKDVLRGLALKTAEIALSPAQQETRRLWRALNAGNVERPMAVCDQLPWHELSKGEESLALTVSDPFWRGIERTLRQSLYKYIKFPMDMVFDPFISLPKAIKSTGFGLSIDQEIAHLDPQNDVVGHKYNNQIETEDDIEKIKIPVVTHDVEETARRKAEGEQLFSGILPVRMAGAVTMFNLWDAICTWMSPEAILYDMADRPEFVHKVMQKYLFAYTEYVMQLEKQGLLSGCATSIHCSPTLGDAPASPASSDDGMALSNVWTCGMAQMFSTVSPKAHKEFELDYVNPVYEKFGAVYYGCCEPLHDRINLVLTIPNLRKVSVSPWCNVEIMAEALAPRGVVVSRKPSPAFLATDSFNAAAVEADIRETMSTCKRSGTALEFILKDVSTVRYQPQRLAKWNSVVMRALNSW